MQSEGTGRVGPRLAWIINASVPTKGEEGDMTTTNLTEADRRVRGAMRPGRPLRMPRGSRGITEVDNRIVVEPPGRPEVLEEIC